MNETLFFINTKGNIRYFLTTREENNRPNEAVALLFGIQRCTELEYKAFKHFWINLKASRADRFKWLKARILKWLSK